MIERIEKMEERHRAEFEKLWKKLSKKSAAFRDRLLEEQRDRHNKELEQEWETVEEWEEEWEEEGRQQEWLRNGLIEEAAFDNSPYNR